MSRDHFLHVRSLARTCTCTCTVAANFIFYFYLLYGRSRHCWFFPTVIRLYIAANFNYNFIYFTVVVVTAGSFHRSRYRNYLCYRLQVTVTVPVTDYRYRLPVLLLRQKLFLLVPPRQQEMMLPRVSRLVNKGCMHTPQPAYHPIQDSAF